MLEVFISITVETESRLLTGTRALTKELRSAYGIDARIEREISEENLGAD